MFNQENAAFLQSIIQNPTCVASRLIYADWLEENGKSIKGRFIRQGCGEEGQLTGEEIELYMNSMEFVSDFYLNSMQESGKYIFKNGFPYYYVGELNGFKPNIFYGKPLEELELYYKVSSNVEIIVRIPKINCLKRIILPNITVNYIEDFSKPFTTTIETFITDYDTYYDEDVYEEIQPTINIIYRKFKMTFEYI